MRRVIRSLSTAFVAAAMTGCEKFALDRQMEALCQKDGGVRVYETVPRPPETFDTNGDPFPGWTLRAREDRLGPDYRFVEEEIYIKRGQPLKGEGQLIRYSTKVIRRSDGKLLGEAVQYGRAGGDFIAFSHWTVNSCPVQQSGAAAIHAVFTKKGV